jgi:hypothetical protein
MAISTFPTKKTTNSARRAFYPAFFLAPGFAGCFSSAAFAGAPPAIGNSISRWSEFLFAAFFPFGTAAAFAAATGCVAGAGFAAGAAFG